MATIKDVARVAGVSVTTVSATINDSAPVSAELRSKVEAAIQTVGYKPNTLARTLRLGHARQIGLLTPELTVKHNAKLTQVLQNELAKRDYGLMLGSASLDATSMASDIARFTDHQTAGILIIAPSSDAIIAPEILKRFQEPLVSLGDLPQSLGCDCISDDHQAGARLIVRHLLQRGFTDLCVIAGKSQDRTVKSRLSALTEAFSQSGSPLADDAIFQNHPDEDQALRAAQNILLKPERPDAIITIQREQTIGVVRALRSVEMNTPEDIALISFEDTGMAEGFLPEVTSLESDIPGMAEKAVEVLLSHIKGKKPKDAGHAPLTHQLSPGLAIRTSTRAK